VSHKKRDRRHVSYDGHFGFMLPKEMVTRPAEWGPVSYRMK